MTINNKAEIKIGIAYDGWKKTGKDRYELPNKVVVAGFARAKEFQLDPFHRNKAVKEKIHDNNARRDIMELLEARVYWTVTKIDACAKFIDIFCYL